MSLAERDDLDAVTNYVATLVVVAETEQIEEIGGELRGMMPFISAGKQKVSDISGG